MSKITIPGNSILLLEGGSLRGLYTAGVLDTFMENDLYFPAVAGVSAGSGSEGAEAGAESEACRCAALV